MPAAPGCKCWNRTTRGSEGNELHAPKRCCYLERSRFCQHPASSALSEEDAVTHVLIIISWLGGAVQGAAISTQEFTSAERCDAARLALIDYAKARGAEETLRGFCKEK